jgi:hypothetical protein
MRQIILAMVLLIPTGAVASPISPQHGPAPTALPSPVATHPPTPLGMAEQRPVPSSSEVKRASSGSDRAQR